MENPDWLTKGVALSVSGSLTLYVAGYYPPEKQGEMHPPHEHIEANSSSAAAVSLVAPMTALSTSSVAFSPLSWPVRL